MNASLVVPIAWPALGPELIGGKAIALCRLAGAGLPVPRGAVLTTLAHQSFINGGNAIIPAEVREALQTALSIARGASNAAVAVRSSAPHEDARNASYAGQLYTQLNVSTEADVEAAVRRCWASACSPRVEVYAQRRAAGLEAAPIAIIIQELIHSTAAGVLFTADPLTGDRATLYIEATYGLGETVVRGEIVPDRYRVNRLTNDVEIMVGEKAIMAIAYGATVRRIAVDTEAQARPVLTADTARALGMLACEAETLMGEPLDIEWTSCGERLYFLQARPITSASGALR